MKDGDFPPFMRGELMFTATYLANRSPHSTLEGATPYSKMHNLEPDLTGLRAIGARAFVYRETYTKKLEDRAFEGKLCGYSHNSKAYRIYNPAKGTVVESRNVTFLETPAYTLPPDVTTEDYHYEEDVLRFTSVLDSSLLEEDLFTPNCDLSSAELEGQVQRLRQEVRRLSKINAAQSPSPSSTPASPGVAMDQRDAGTREPEPASPSINQEPENEDEYGPPLPAAPVTGPSLRIRSDGRPFEVTRASTRRSPSSKDTEYTGALHTLFPTYDQGTLAITQTDYVDNLLERFEMQNTNVAHTPGYGQELSSEQPEDKLLGAQGIKLYQSITGSLLYLAQCTRYDLCYAVNQLTRACNRPAEVHMTAAKHVLRYLRGTPDLPITYRKGRLRLVSYTDASFGANSDNRKSTMGYMFFLGGAPISFGSKTQSPIAQSIVESELQALSYGAREAVYLSNFLTELELKDPSQVPIRSNSTGALSVAGNSMFSARTKHIALRYFFVRELVKKNNITLHYTPTKQMLADIATKHLSKHTFRDLLQQIKNFTS